MTLRLLNDDFFFRRPLIDRFFDDDDFYLFDRVGDSLHRLLRQQERVQERERAQQEKKAENNANTINNADGRSNSDPDALTSSDAKPSTITSNTTANATATPTTTTNTTGGLPSLLRSAAFGFMGTDLIESDSDFHIHVDLPGVQPEDLDVSVVDKYLMLKAERKHVHEDKSDKVHSMERSYGTVQRKIRIPQNADVDQASVKLRNGVLSISVPKKAPAVESVRKLAVKVENEA